MGLPDDSLIGGTLAGRYRIDRRIGAGGMGAVYEATRLDDGRKVAIKVLLEAEPRAVARFHQEALANANVASPHVVNVLGFIAEEGGQPPFLVMELLEGEPLSRLLAREKTLSLKRTIAITRQVLAGLEAAHRLSIVHRDIKPSNIWLVGREDDIVVKVLDFGIAKLLVDPRAYKTTTGSVVGTPSYLAPEQINGDPVDARTDLHAVAICLFEMLTGERPWGPKRGPDVVIAILMEQAPLLSTKLANAPPALTSLIERALSKELDERPDSASAMSAELAAIGSSIDRLAHSATETIAIQKTDEAPPPPRPKKAAKRSAAPRTFSVAFVSTLLAACVLLAVVLPRVKKRLTAAPPSPPIDGSIATMDGPEASSPPPLITEADGMEADGSSTFDASSFSSSSLKRHASASSPPPTPSDGGPGMSGDGGGATRPFCRCQMIVRGDTQDICDTPMPLDCECVTHDTKRIKVLCAHKYVFSKTRTGKEELTCPGFGHKGPDVKFGGKCLGYQEPKLVESPESPQTVHAINGAMPFEGKYDLCSDCYQSPLRPGTPNAPCKGFANGVAQVGTWKCW